MAHDVDGYEVTFTHRASWKAHVTLLDRLVGTVPVTWTKGTVRDAASGKFYQQVWFQDAAELEVVNSSTEPFLVAVAVAHDYDMHPHSFKQFNCIYEVRALGRKIDEISIQCEVLRRLRR